MKFLREGWNEYKKYAIPKTKNDWIQFAIIASILLTANYIFSK